MSLIKTLILKIYFKYKNNKSFTLNNINLKIERNSAIAIIGKSGAGKSTLIDVISGLLEPTKGSIFIDNKPLKKKIYLSNKFSYVGQNIFLFNDTLAQNISMKERMTPKEFTKIKKIIRICELKFKLNKKINEIDNISGGEKQRIALARALFVNPDFLILDEPTSSLDENTKERIKKILIKISKKVSLLIISHDKSLTNFCRKIYKLENGFLKKIR